MVKVMGREQLQGTPWHEERAVRKCKTGSTYCVYNQQTICRCKASDYHKKTCVGKGFCDWFESKGGTSKKMGKDIYIRIVPQNSKREDIHLPDISIKRKVIMGGEEVETYFEREMMDDFDISEEESDNQNETKNEKFLRIAEVRVNKLLGWLRKIDNLSNKNNYEYTDEQAQQIFDFIQDELDEVKKHFLDSEKEKKKFKFK